MPQGQLYVISGPSGAGKGTLCRALLAREDLALLYSISATTRKPRPGEGHGREYFFLERREFEEAVRRGEFLEWAEVYGNLYGTPRGPVEAAIASGRDIILEIDIQGALQLKQSFPGGVFIFVLPPSLEELEARLAKRGADSEEAVRRRLSEAAREMGYVSRYDYLVLNNRVDEALKKLEAIIVAERCRPYRHPWP